MAKKIKKKEKVDIKSKKTAKIESEPEKKQEKPETKAFSVESKLIISLLIIAVAFVAFAFFIRYFIDSSKTIDYHGVEFIVEKTGNLVLYHTQIPYLAKNKSINYNFWIRNNPKALEKTIPFEGELYVRQIIVFNMSNTDFKCNGDEIIAMANLAQLYQVLGVTIASDPNATCDDYNTTGARYVYVNIQPGNETSITQSSNACYTINVKNCEILKATERYMTETFVAMNDYLKK